MFIVFIRHADSQGLTYLFADDVNFTSGVLSVDEQLSESFSFYPNPVVGTLYMQNSSGKTINEITITNAEGRIVKSVTANEGNTSIDVSGLATGSYFVKATVEGGSVIKQIIKR